MVQWISANKLTKEIARLFSLDYSGENKKVQDKMFT